MILKTLISIELKRTWTLGKIVTVSALTLIACIITLIPIWLDIADSFPAMKLDFSEMLFGVFKILVPFSVFFFASGIISNDVKNHWARSVLTAAVTRQDFLLSKLLSATISVLFIMILLGALPLAVFDIFSEISFDYSFSAIISVIFFQMLNTLLYITVAAWISCLVGGFLNIFLLAIWMFLDNVVVKGILAGFFENNIVGSMFVDFFFPSGFSDAAQVIGSSGSFPFEFILWGLAALTLFGSLVFWNVNKLLIDTSSD
ncbi:MAG: hypothetical protein KIT33_01165 [Candidatus Kapabacteria bacterium]|nr:hypothetical protein [Ignavibacteriota bacterium]MCW5883558.1 hypothetical protein [Candidatus Kapabacteria bacterium]